MSILFSSDFSDINVWEYHFGAGTPPFGCSGSPCLTCGSIGTFGVWQTLGSFTAGSARMMFAAVAQAIDPVFSFDPFLFLWTPAPNNILFEIRLDVLGKINIHSIGGATTNSPDGLIPVNGTFHTLQITWNLYLASDGVGQGVFADIQFVLDNSVIFTKLNHYVSAYNHGPSTRDYHWGRIGFAGNGALYSAGHWLNLAIDNVEVEDVVIVKTMTPCTTGQLSNTTCALIIPPPPDLSGLYFMNPVNTHDKYITAEKKIPNPTIRTAGIGE